MAQECDSLLNKAISNNQVWLFFVLATPVGDFSSQMDPLISQLKVHETFVTFVTMLSSLEKWQLQIYTKL